MSDNVDENKQPDRSTKHVRGGKTFPYPAYEAAAYVAPPAYFNYDYQYQGQPATYTDKPIPVIKTEERKVSDAVLKLKEQLKEKGVKINEDNKPTPPANADKAPPPPSRPFIPQQTPVVPIPPVNYVPRPPNPVNIPPPVAAVPPPPVAAAVAIPSKPVVVESAPLPALKVDAKPFIPSSIKTEKEKTENNKDQATTTATAATKPTIEIPPPQSSSSQQQQSQPKQTTTTTTEPKKEEKEKKPIEDKKPPPQQQPAPVQSKPAETKKIETTTTAVEKEKEKEGGEEDDDTTETDEKKIEEIETKIEELHKNYGIFIYPAEILEFFRDSLDEDDIKKGKDNVANYKVFIKDRNNIKYIPLQGSFMKSKQSNVVLKRAKDRFNIKRRKDEDESFFGAIRVSLNKLSEDNYDVVSADILKQEFKSYSQCQKLVELLFEKAVMEKSFCKIYAKLCAKLNSESNNLIKKLIHTEFLNGVYTILVDGTDKKEEFIPSSQDEKSREEEVYEKAFDCFSFRRIILGICQNEFSKEVRFDELEKKRSELNNSRPPESSNEYLDWYREYDDLEIEQTRMKTRMLGTVHFIGELYLQKKAKGDKKTLITKQIISKSCFPTLLKNPDDDDKIEALCKLLTTIGSKFAREDESSLNEVVNKLKELQTNTKLSTRVRISVIPDLLDIAAKGWGGNNNNNNNPSTPTPVTPPTSNNNRNGPSPRSTRHSNNRNNNNSSQDVRGNTPHKVFKTSSSSTHNNNNNTQKDNENIPTKVAPVPLTPSSSSSTTTTTTSTTNKKDGGGGGDNEEEEVVELTKKDKDLIVGFWTGYVDERGKDSSITDGFDDLKRTKGRMYDILIIGYSTACNKYSSSKNEEQLNLFLNLMDILIKGSHEKQPDEYKIMNNNNKPIINSLDTFIKKEIEGLIDDIPKATEIMGRIISIYIINNKYSLKELYELLKGCSENDNKSFTIEIFCHTISILEKNSYSSKQIEKEIEELNTDLIELTDDNVYPIPQQLYKLFISCDAGKYFPQYSEALHLLKLIEKKEIDEAKKLVESLGRNGYLEKYEFIGLYLYGLTHSKVDNILKDGIAILVEVSKQVKTPVCIQSYILKGITSSCSFGAIKIKYEEIIALLKSNGLLSKEAIELFKKDNNFFPKKTLHLKTLESSV